jgi:hypothetical protein
MLNLPNEIIVEIMALIEPKIDYLSICKVITQCAIRAWWPILRALIEGQQGAKWLIYTPLARSSVDRLYLGLIKARCTISIQQLEIAHQQLLANECPNLIHLAPKHTIELYRAILAAHGPESAAMRALIGQCTPPIVDDHNLKLIVVDMIEAKSSLLGQMKGQIIYLLRSINNFTSYSGKIIRLLGQDIDDIFMISILEAKSAHHVQDVIRSAPHGRKLVISYAELFITSINNVQILAILFSTIGPLGQRELIYYFGYLTDKIGAQLADHMGPKVSNREALYEWAKNNNRPRLTNYLSSRLGYIM